MNWRKSLQAGVDSDPDADADKTEANTDPIADKSPPLPGGRTCRHRPPINYNNMSITSHLKSVGYNSLMSGASALNSVLHGYTAMLSMLSQNKTSPVTMSVLQTTAYYLNTASRRAWRYLAQLVRTQ